MLSVSCSGWQGHVAVHQESHCCSLLLQPGLVYWEPHPGPWYVCQERCRVSSFTMQHYCLNFRIIIYRSNNLKCYKKVIFQLMFYMYGYSANVKSNYLILNTLIFWWRIYKTREMWLFYYLFLPQKTKFDKCDCIWPEIKSIKGLNV